MRMKKGALKLFYIVRIMFEIMLSTQCFGSYEREYVYR